MASLVGWLFGWVCCWGGPENFPLTDSGESNASPPCRYPYYGHEANKVNFAPTGIVGTVVQHLRGVNHFRLRWERMRTVLSSGFLGSVVHRPLELRTLPHRQLGQGNSGKCIPRVAWGFVHFRSRRPGRRHLSPRRDTTRHSSALQDSVSQEPVRLQK